METLGSSTQPVIDLTRYPNAMGALQSYEDIASLLTVEDEGRLVAFVRSMAKMAYFGQQRRYEYWDRADEAYDVYVPPDSTDFREKAVTTDARAVADTVIVYLMSALTGRNPMFQLKGLDRKSRRAAAVTERILHQQIKHTTGEARIAQMLLNSVRYGYAPIRNLWSDSANSNILRNYDPRHAFIDPRVNQSRIDEMQFMILTDYKTTQNLRTNSARYPRMRTRSELTLPTTTQRTGWEIHQHRRPDARGTRQDDQLYAELWTLLGTARTVDEVWLHAHGEMFGYPNIQSMWVVITVLDEKHIIEFRLSPVGAQFPIAIGGVYFDEHKNYQQAVMDLLQPLHDITKWLLRSRVDNVQAALSNLIFADPNIISIPDLINRHPSGVVPVQPGFQAGEGLFIAQVPDVTQGHWNDISFLSEQMKVVSAASDLQQGMPSPSVRTATEIQRMSIMGTQRLGLLSRIMSATVIRPLVRLMVDNIQDSLDKKGELGLDGQNVPKELAGQVRDGFLDYVPADLQGDIAYEVISGVDKADPTRDPQVLLQVLQVLESTGMLAEYDASAIVNDLLLNAMGVSNLDEYRLKSDAPMSPSQQLQMLQRTQGQTQVQEQEQVSREVERGNLVPIRQATSNLAGNQ